MHICTFWACAAARCLTTTRYATACLARYREFWKNAQSTIVFLVGLVQFLEDGRLISLREVEEMLDRTCAPPNSPSFASSIGFVATADAKDPSHFAAVPGEVEAEGAQSSFAIDIPDFLYGLAMIPNELVTHNIMFRRRFCNELTVCVWHVVSITAHSRACVSTERRPATTRWSLG